MGRGIAFCCLLGVLLIAGCKSDDQDLLPARMTATIDGTRIEFKADKAKVFAGTNGSLTLLGTNCEVGKRAIRLDVPPAEGQYTLQTIFDASYYTGAAFACPGETGTSTQWRVLEAEVIISELTDSYISGTFSMLADNPNPEWADAEIDGSFDIPLE